MDDILEKNIESWTVWLEFEKRVSKNTVISYKSDLISFLRFFKEYESLFVYLKKTLENSMYLKLFTSSLPFGS